MTDFKEDEGLFVTGGEDGFVKVWTYQKQLIREIKFPKEVNCVSFISKTGDILVGHKEKISILKADDYYPNKRPHKLEEEDKVEINDKLFFKLK